MKIIKLTAENVKALKAVEIEPSGNVVVITGENGAGKSSILDSIEYALYGGRSLPERPIRSGQQSARIELDLGTIIVERSFTKKGSYLTIRGEDDTKVTSPQKFLDDIVGEISLDPYAFSNEPDPKKQRKILLDLLGVDLDANATAIAELREERRIINKDIQANKGTLASFAEPPADMEIPEEEISVVELANKRAEATVENTRLQSHIDGASQTRKHIDQLQATLAEHEAYIKTHTLIEIDEIAQKMASAEKVNVFVRQNKSKANVKKRLKDAQAEYKKKGADMELLEQGKAELLRDAKMPVKGLSVDDDGVMFNGIPMAQIASSEKLKVGVAVAMALNPELRVLHIKDGSLLDEANMQVIADMVKEKDYQVWVERVSDKGAAAIVVEDGSVKE